MPASSTSIIPAGPLRGADDDRDLQDLDNLADDI